MYYETSGFPGQLEDVLLSKALKVLLFFLAPYFSKTWIYSNQCLLK